MGTASGKGDEHAPEGEGSLGAFQELQGARLEL